MNENDRKDKFTSHLRKIQDDLCNHFESGKSDGSREDILSLLYAVQELIELLYWAEIE